MRIVAGQSVQQPAGGGTFSRSHARRVPSPGLSSVRMAEGRLRAGSELTAPDPRTCAKEARQHRHGRLATRLRGHGLGHPVLLVLLVLLFLSCVLELQKVTGCGLARVARFWPRVPGCLVSAAHNLGQKSRAVSTMLQ